MGWETFWVAHCRAFTVQVVGPTVIGANDLSRAFALSVVEQDMRTMSANVVECFYLIGICAYNESAFFVELKGDVASGFWQVARVAHQLP